MVQALARSLDRHVAQQLRRLKDGRGLTLATAADLDLTAPHEQVLDETRYPVVTRRIDGLPTIQWHGVTYVVN